MIPEMLVFSIIYADPLVWISALAQHVDNLTSHGIQWVAGDRSKAVPDVGYAGRAARALPNNLEFAAMYVPIALVALVRNETSTVLT
jgi:uncharacterized MAPEG superfamily protein